jgi:hypothetical protein
MRNRCWLLAAATMLCSSGVARAAPPSPAHLLVTGSATTSVTWHLRSRVQLDTHAWAVRFPPGMVKGSGHVAGLVIRHGDQVVFGLVADRDIGDPILVGADKPILSPGRYSVTLIADGPTSIDLPLGSSSPSYRLSPAVRTGLVRRSVSALPSAPSPLVYGSTPIAASRRSLLIVAARVSATAEQADTRDLCLSTRNEPCNVARVDGSGVDGLSGPTVLAGNVGDNYSVSAIALYPGELEAGTYYAGIDEVAIGLATTARLVALDVTL